MWVRYKPNSVLWFTLQQELEEGKGVTIVGQTHHIDLNNPETLVPKSWSFNDLTTKAQNATIYFWIDNKALQSKVDFASAEAFRKQKPVEKVGPVGGGLPGPKEDLMAKPCTPDKSQKSVLKKEVLKESYRKSVGTPLGKEASGLALDKVAEPVPVGEFRWETKNAEMKEIPPFKSIPEVKSSTSIAKHPSLQASPHTPLPPSQVPLTPSEMTSAKPKLSTRFSLVVKDMMKKKRLKKVIIKKGVVPPQHLFFQA